MSAGSTLTTLEPEWPRVTAPINGSPPRERVLWTGEQLTGDPEGDVEIGPGTTLTLIFQVLATSEVSGNYYNEVLVTLRNIGVPGSAFTEAGVLGGEANSGYSWNTGMVTVPTYDSSAEAEGVILDANMALIVGGITITSYNYG